MTTTADIDTDTTADYDPLAALTISELNDGSRQLKASLVAAVTQQTEHYEKALAVVLWLHTRRSDPGAGLGRFLELSFTDLTEQLMALAPDEDRPTTPKPSSS